MLDNEPFSHEYYNKRVSNKSNVYFTCQKITIFIIITNFPFEKYN